MLKFFYRLKRRGGVVLFAVIAIMTLLIAMATSAYMSARASFQTVVSNYDFTQTYLSAVAVSDMLIDAVSQDTAHSDTNKFDDLKTAITNMEKTGTAKTYVFYEKETDIDPKTTTENPDENVSTLVGYSKHGPKGSRTAATESNILTKAAEDPVVAGALDAVKTEIKLMKTIKCGDTEARTCYLTFTTTAYYRDTTVVIQDTVKHVQKTTQGTPTPFSRFFTATGQKADGDDLSRTVWINTFNVSDDAYFENAYTYFAGPQDGVSTGNYFKGSLVSSGSVWLNHAKFDGYPGADNNDNSKPRCDWFIGEDLIIGHANANAMNLNGGNLYVGGNLIICSGTGANITAHDIYVRGKIICLETSGSPKIKCDHLYVGSGGTSDITGDSTEAITILNKYRTALQNMGRHGLDSVSFSNGSASRLTIESAGGVGVWNDSYSVYFTSPKLTETGYIKENQPSTLGEAFEVRTENLTYDPFVADDSVYENEVNIDFALPKVWQINNAINECNNSGVYDSTVTSYGSTGSTGYVNWVNNGDGTYQYKRSVLTKFKVKDAEYNPTYIPEVYTSTSETFEYIVAPNGSGGYMFMQKDPDNPSIKNTVASIDGSGNMTFYSKDDSEIKVSESGGRYKVEVPYDSNGYLLGIYNALTTSGKIDYVFHTQDPTEPTSKKKMTVALKPNFTDDSGTMCDNGGYYNVGAGGRYNAFSWTGDKNGVTDQSKTVVECADNGYLFLEAADYMINTETHKVEFKPYDSSKWDKFCAPTIYETEELLVGSTKQISDLRTANLGNTPGLSSMHTNGYAKTGYDNRVMLVSNKNLAVAMDGSSTAHLLCGYLYAPNGYYDARCGSSTYPTFGGMIVSGYLTAQTTFEYLSPDPELIEDFLTMVHGSHERNNLSIDVWEINEGKNYIE